MEQANPLKILLNQQNSEQLDRYIQYEKILNQTRLQAINQIQSLLSELQQTEEAVQTKSASLQNEKQQAAAQQVILRKLYLQRKKVVQAFNQKLQSQ